MPSVVEKICRLPIDFRDGGNKSPIELVRHSGVSDQPELLTVEGVEQVLRTEPGLVDAWQNWSCDNRSASGWCLCESGAGWTVEFFPKGERLWFRDRFNACANFIIRETISICGKDWRS